MQRVLNKEYKKLQEALTSLFSPTNYAMPVSPIVEIKPIIITWGRNVIMDIDVLVHSSGKCR